MELQPSCTRRCPFCDVGHGRPLPLDQDEPRHLAETIAKLKLKYVVITSVDRDDLRDGGAEHFVNCIRETRARSPTTQIEILTPDFRGRLDRALGILRAAPPDVMNHNLETVPRLYLQARPGSDYAHSLKLLKDFKVAHPDTPTKSGLMLGLGETNAEILDVMKDLRAHDVEMLTIGQYLQPSICRYCGMWLRMISTCLSVKHRSWDSSTRRAGRWCGLRIMRTDRRARRGSRSSDSGCRGLPAISTQPKTLATVREDHRVCARAG